MPRDDFKRDLNDAFERMSGSPSSDLQARVRSAIVDAPERRRPLWVAGVAAAVIAVVVIGTLIVIGPLRSFQPPPVPGGHGSPTPTASPSPSPTDNLPPFICSSRFMVSGTQAPQSALVDAVRVGQQSGYDRFVVEFANGEPASVTVTTQNSTDFTKSPSGLPTHLMGSYGMTLRFNIADGHTQYTGPRDFKPVYPTLLEAQQLEDYEGYVTWGLGLSGHLPYRVFFLTNPSRLVVDMQTTGVTCQ